MMGNENQHIYLIDGHALCYRAYYAIRELSTSKGMPTNAIYGFINILRKLLRQYEPEMLAVVFDTPAPTVRHEKYKKYKIHRKPMPDDLIQQIPRIKEVVAAYGMPIYEMEGYEADDIIATLSTKAKKKGVAVTIVTGDKDALQLVDDKVRVLSSHTMGDKVYDASAVKDKYGVEPSEMVDLMAFIGDVSDNIPGVKGIGKVSAAKLINRYGDVKGVYENIDKISSASAKKKLEEGKDMARLSRELIQLDKEVPVKLDLRSSIVKEPDFERLAELYKEFEFKKLLNNIMPKQVLVEGQYSSEPDEVEINDAIKKIKNRKRVALSVSIDQGGGTANGVALSWEKGEAIYCPFPEGVNSSDKVFCVIKALLEDDGVRKAGYDLKSDMLILHKSGIDIRGIEFDVMISDYLIDPSGAGYELEDIVARRLEYGAVDLTGGEDPRSVCIRCDMVWQLFDVLSGELKEKDLDTLFREVEMPLVSVLADMENEGVDVDVEYLKERSKTIAEKLKETAERIYEFSGGKFNINSPKQLQVILYEKLKLPAIRKTKTGISTDESVLRKLASFHELPSILVNYRQMNKLKTGYYDSILELADEPSGQRTRRLHTHFNQAVTSTGRLSSSGPNLQNIPIKTAMGREIRKAFVPGGKNNILLAADYSQIELRILAHLSKDKTLIDEFRNGKDVHTSTASEIFDCALEEVTEDMRSSAKTVNFGVIYGMSAFGLAKDLEISIKEAQQFIDSYFNRYEGVKSFMDNTIGEVRRKGFATTLLNRRRYIPEINSSNERIRGFAERAAINTPVQGSAADLIKLAMIACFNKFKNTDVRMIIQVHDELVFKLPVDKLKDVARQVRDIMEGVIEIEVPLKVDSEAGENWMDMDPVFS